MTKSKIFNRTVTAAVAVSLGLTFGITRLNVQAQSSRVSGPLVNKTVENKPAAARNEFSAAITRAAYENGRLKNTLKWNFGGRQQAGWGLYSGLIAHTIGADPDPDSPEFAAALSVWQTKNGLNSSGILDQDTLSALIKTWQSQRLGRSSYPPDEQLLSAPISEFYDPTRSPDLLKLERETYAAYKRMIAAAAKDLKNELKLTKDGELAPDEKYLRIVSAFRSREYQEQLRRQQPGAGRAALAKNSPHATGQALDIYVGGEPVTTKDANRAIQVQTPVYKWLVENANRFGFYNYFYEPWHWEYVPGK